MRTAKDAMYGRGGYLFPGHSDSESEAKLAWRGPMDGSKSSDEQRD